MKFGHHNRRELGRSTAFCKATNKNSDTDIIKKYTIITTTTKTNNKIPASLGGIDYVLSTIMRTIGPIINECLYRQQKLISLSQVLHLTSKTTNSPLAYFTSEVRSTTLSTSSHKKCSKTSVRTP